jgi:hypothetical protein
MDSLSKKYNAMATRAAASEASVFELRRQLEASNAAAASARAEADGLSSRIEGYESAARNAESTISRMKLDLDDARNEAIKSAARAEEARKQLLAAPTAEPSLVPAPSAETLTARPKLLLLADAEAASLLLPRIDAQGGSSLEARVRNLLDQVRECTERAGRDAQAAAASEAELREEVRLYRERLDDITTHLAKTADELVSAERRASELEMRSFPSSRRGSVQRTPTSSRRGSALPSSIPQSPARAAFAPLPVAPESVPAAPAQPPRRAPSKSLSKSPPCALAAPPPPVVERDAAVSATLTELISAAARADSAAALAEERAATASKKLAAARAEARAYERRCDDALASLEAERARADAAERALRRLTIALDDESAACGRLRQSLELRGIRPALSTQSLASPISAAAETFRASPQRKIEDMATRLATSPSRSMTSALVASPSRSNAAAMSPSPRAGAASPSRARASADVINAPTSTSPPKSPSLFFNRSLYYTRASDPAGVPAVVQAASDGIAAPSIDLSSGESAAEVHYVAMRNRIRNSLREASAAVDAVAGLSSLGSAASLGGTNAGFQHRSLITPDEPAAAVLLSPRDQPAAAVVSSVEEEAASLIFELDREIRAEAAAIAARAIGTRMMTG